MSDRVMKLLRKVESGVESFFRGSEEFAKRAGLEVVGDVEDAATVADQEAKAVEADLTGKTPEAPAAEAPKE